MVNDYITALLSVMQLPDKLLGHVHVDHVAPLRKMLLQGKLRDISEGKCDVDYRMIFPKKQKRR